MPKTVTVALRKESVDRNLDAVQIVIVIMQSLSARRAWIEIGSQQPDGTTKTSLSARRAWIEISDVVSVQYRCKSRSPQGERG